MSLYSFLLQVPVVGNVTSQVDNDVIQESYLSLIMKGGWIMLPIFLFFLLAIYIIIYKFISISSIGKTNRLWLSKTLEFVHEQKIDKALFISTEMETAESAIVLAGLKEWDNGVEEVENAMELEARVQLNKLERNMNLLAITASIAPMLGFLGTIFGVIKIFYNIAQTNDLSIGNISAGLYEKMICSGSGLLVGIIAYMGYNLLSTKIDNIILRLDWSSNQVLKSVKKTLK